MTSGRAAPACVATLAMCAASLCRAGVWGSEPLIGILGDYSTDPALLGIADSAEEHAALLFDAPTTYHADASTFSILPRFRIGNSPGYTYTTSDYEHLDLKGEFDTERNVLVLAAGIAQDSSLYHDYTFDGSTGVRRDSVTADVNWARQLTERTGFGVDLGSSRVRYGASSGAPTLTDYQYTSFTPQFAWDESEKGKFTATLSGGLYKSLDGTTESRNVNTQLGFVRHLTEIWTLTANAGYSRALNRVDFDSEVLVLTPEGFGIALIPRSIESSQNGSVYGINLSHQGNRLVFTLAASHQLAPTGFAFLSSQQTYEGTESYTASSRWTISGDVRYVNYKAPTLTGGAETRQDYRYAGLSSAWRWTEWWTLTTNISRVMENIQATNPRRSSTEISIELSRQFKRITF